MRFSPRPRLFGAGEKLTSHRPARSTTGGWVVAIALLILVSGCTTGSDAAQITDPTATSTAAAGPASTTVPAAVSTSDLPLPQAATGPYPVVSVTDGDTIRVDVDGVEEKIRLIGIDAPELHNPVECFGREATDRATSLLQGASVALEADDTQDDRDRYGRLLRYVYLPDGTNVNAALISGGYAFEYTYDNPYRYRTEFLADQSAAEAAGTGLWSSATCGGRPSASPDPVAAPSTTTTTTDAASQQPSAPACAIKGNINTKGERIFHQPGDASYADTVITPGKGERYFCSVEEAIAAGWRAPRN